MNPLPELDNMPEPHLNEVFGQIIVEPHLPEALKKVQQGARTKWFNIKSISPQFKVGTAIAVTIPLEQQNREVALRMYALFTN